MSNSTNTNTTPAHPSTLQSYIDSATGYVQETLSGLTGSTGDKTNGQAKQEKAKAEYDASQAGINVAGYSASSSGAIAKNDPARSEGAWNQTIGSAKETVGGLIGSESWKQAGREQNLKGQQQEAKGQLNDLSSGVADRVTGTIGGAVAGLTSDRDAQRQFEDQHDTGKTKQRGVEHDLQKQADARQAIPNGQSGK